MEDRKKVDIESESMPDLPLELTTEILLQQPVKSLVRFSGASKSWHALIHSPGFIKLHLQRCIDTNRDLVVIRDDTCLYSVDLDTDVMVELDHPLEPNSRLLGSCNGVLCLWEPPDSGSLKADRGGKIGLLNPSTKKHHILPMAPIEFNRFWPVGIGFGYDQLNDDYKVVKIVKNDWDNCNEVKVYSLKTNAWTRIQDFPYHFPYENMDPQRGVVTSGALHWVVSQQPESIKLIAAFDIGTEQFRIVPQPKKISFMNVGVLRGCLCIVRRYWVLFWEVWVMKDYGVQESWTKLFSVERHPHVDYLIPLCYSKSRREVLFAHHLGSCVSYDLKGNRVKAIEQSSLNEAEMLVETLVPLGTDDEKKKKKKKKKGSR